MEVDLNISVTQTARPPLPRKQLSGRDGFPFAFPATTICFRNRMPAWLFMWTLSFAIFAALKWMTWWKARNRVRHTAGARSPISWPGPAWTPRLSSIHAQPARPRLQGMALGGVEDSARNRVALGNRAPDPGRTTAACGWIGLFGLIFLLHFGSFHLIALFWQAMGIDAATDHVEAHPLETLSEFWGKRWNLGFRQLAHDFIFRPLHKRIGAGRGRLAGVCRVGADSRSGHLSAGARRIWPAHRIFHSPGTRRHASNARLCPATLGLQNGLPARIFTFVVTAAPAFWLFHPPFVLRVIIPFMQAIHAL